MRWRTILIFMSAVVLTACATPPVAMNATPGRIASDLGLPEASITKLVQCSSALAVPGEKSAIFVDCVYAPLPDGALLIAFSEKQQNLVLLQKLGKESANAVGYKEMGNAKQIQVHSDAGFIVFSLLSDSRAWPANAENRAAFEHLRSLGIPETEPLQYVFAYRPIRVEAHYY